ncbi:hypothetical protein H6F93_02215 [Leptolyngbya sp. FACHB-671]|nr:hypothetical protein [Cyanobacteria bacterium FACHB-471]MBD2066350.1 hypothetical protein [Leptolyngbya sp. FACHB-671]
MSSHGATTQAGLIAHLNPIITGWCQYYATVVSKEAFASMSYHPSGQLLRWAKHRHPRLNTHQIVSLYWRVNQGDGWVFQIEVHHQDGNHGNQSLNNLKLLHRHCHDQVHAAATTPKTGIPDNEPSWRGAGCTETGKSGFEAKQMGRPTYNVVSTRDSSLSFGGHSVNCPPC